MDLAVDREAIIFETLNNLAYPAGPAPVQHARVQALDHFHQLLVRAGPRYRGVPHVVVHIHVFLHSPLGHSHAGKMRIVIEWRYHRGGLKGGHQVT
jgi:hypothetical protein